jgi:AcrR family transcriptional regulator
MPRKPQQKRSKETVQSILDAGFIAVANHGRHGATTRQIAEIAGISVGSLYEYFTNKEAIYVAMLERFVREVVAMVEPRVPELVRMELKELVIDLVYQFKEFMERNDGLYLKCAPYALPFDSEKHSIPVEKLLTDLFTQYAMHNPEAMRVRDFPALAYIVINGALFTITRYLIGRPSHLSFEQLANGLGNMIAGYVAEERRAFGSDL